MSSPEATLLLAEGAEPIELYGRLYAAMAPFLDGRHTVEDLCALLAPQLTVLDISYGLSQLEQHGYLVDDDGDLFLPALAAFRDRLGIAPRLFSERLSGTAVSVHCFGTVQAKLLSRALLSLGIRLVEEGALAIAVVDDCLHEDLEVFNRQSLELGRPWMMLKPLGAIPWIGPIFYPGRTACWSCLAQRLHESGSPVARGGVPLPTIFQAVVNLAATHTLKWICSNESRELEGVLVTLDAASFKIEQHAVVRREDCRGCGKPKDRRPAAPLILESRRKVFAGDGGHRSAAPESVYRRYQHHVSPITGIVRSLRPSLDDPQGLVHVYIAEHAFSLQYDRGAQLQWTRARRSAGKGMAEAQARTSALCEALERYSGVFRGDESVCRGSYSSLRSAAVHPQELLHFSARQYAAREEWNRCESDFNWVPQPFDPDREIDWTPVWSLTRKELRYLPSAYLYYSYPICEEHDFCRADSNGNAAGPTLEDAILQGFLEIAERDSVAMWWYNRVRRPAVDLEDFDQPYFTALRRHYQTVGREFWVLDITGDLGIPAFAAVSRRQDGEPHFIFGFGAHLDAELAVCRALTEMNQFLPSVSPPFSTAATLDAGFLMPDPEVAPLKSARFPRLWSDDIREDVCRCVELAGARDLEVIVLDQTRSEAGVAVVKVIVPGMRSFWARFGPGRLYTVPVDLGWISASLTEGVLNPAHLCI